MGTMTVQFWGVRGTLPVPGEKTVRYGGNTNCVTLQIGDKPLFIFDAGTGLKELSNHLLSSEPKKCSAKIFISHPHYDHINTLPFFAPFFVKGYEFEIFGAQQGDKTIKDLISGQMDNVYLPFTIAAFAANLRFRNIAEESFMLDEVRVDTQLLVHPGRCLGYRVTHGAKVFCYITDNELYLKDSSHFKESDDERLVNFIKGCNFLVIDATYTDDEYVKKVGWGHSSISRVVEVAVRAKVKSLCLFHHDPGQGDVEIDHKLGQARALLKAQGSSLSCIAACEGEKIEI